MKIIINWIIAAAAIGIAAWLIPGVHVSLVSAFMAAAVLGIINTLIRPIIVLFTLPVTVLTLGLFTFVINGLLVLLAAQIVPGFQVDGFLTAVLFSIALALANMILHVIVPDSLDN